LVYMNHRTKELAAKAATAKTQKGEKT